MKKRLIGFLIVGLAFVSYQSTAHHAFSGTFKADSKITIEGEVVRFNFRNPHATISLDVIDDDGNSVRWVVEGDSVNNLRRYGWSRESLNIGDIIRITGDSTHDGSPMITLISVSILDKQSGTIVATLHGEGEVEEEAEEGLVLINRPLLLADGRPNLTGLWTGIASPYEPPRDPALPYNQAGKAQQAAYDPTSDPQVFCEQPGLIRQAGMTRYAVRINQQDDRILLDYEEYGNSRVVYFDERNFLGIASHFGDSIARYEGDTLVIETINLLPDLASPEGNRLSDQTKVVQRFKRVDEEEYGALLSMETTTTDPVLLADEFVLSNIKVAVEDQPFDEVECSAPLRDRTEVHPYMSFFLTSVGLGDGGNLSGLEGADAHCAALASTVGQGEKKWAAYLSTTGEQGVDARDRIGSGPWYNSHGIPIAINLAELHGDENAAPRLNKVSALDERGRQTTQTTSTDQEDGINSRHDVITGTQLDGTAFDSEENTTCGNWTLSQGGGTVAGHSDRRGGGPNPNSWVYAHPTRGCSLNELAASDGEGYFYCFATGD